MSNIYGNRITSYLVWKLLLQRPRFRRFVTAMVVPNRTQRVELLGAKICIHRRDEIGYWRASRQQHGNVVFRDEVPTLLRIAQASADASSFVDCGANVGLFTAVMLPLKIARPSVEFYAFEPNPEAFARLRETVAGKDVHLENVALSNKEGYLEMVGGATSGVFGVPGGPFQAGAMLKVPAKRLDSCSFEGDSLFLKIDVEGHELEVLEGANGLFKQGRVSGVYVDGAKKEQGCLEFLRKHRLAAFNSHSLESYKLGDCRLLALRERL